MSVLDIPHWGRINQGCPRLDRGSVKSHPFFESRGAAKDHVDAARQFECFLFGRFVVEGLDFDESVHGAQRLGEMGGARQAET